jgi:uncharacterized protein
VVRRRRRYHAQIRSQALAVDVARSRTRSRLLALSALAAAAALAYLAILLWFRVNEDSLIFHPERGNLVPPAAWLDLESRDVALRDGGSKGTGAATLMARVIPPPTKVPAEAAAWILYFHGAGGNVGTLGYNEAWAKFRRMGLGVLAVDYRGFGQSSGEPSEAGLYQDADASYAYLVDVLHVSPLRIVIYGYSLGSAVAIDLATRVPAAGLIVEGAFISIPARGAEMYPYLPVKWLARNRFASVDKIAHVRMPKLFIHARHDTYVPISHGRVLFELARPPKFFQDVAGGHTNAHKVDPAFFAAIARFMTGLRLPLAQALAP